MIHFVVTETFVFGRGKTSTSQVGKSLRSIYLNTRNHRHYSYEKKCISHSISMSLHHIITYADDGLLATV